MSGDDRRWHPGFDVVLHCNRCDADIAKVLNVVRDTARLEHDEASLSEVRDAMAAHDVERHGGVAR